MVWGQIFILDFADIVGSFRLKSLLGDVDEFYHFSFDSVSRKVLGRMGNIFSIAQSAYDEVGGTLLTKLNNMFLSISFVWFFWFVLFVKVVNNKVEAQS